MNHKGMNYKQRKLLELVIFADKFMESHYGYGNGSTGIKHELPIRVNYFMKEFYGAFRLVDNKPHCIDLAADLFWNGTMDEIKQILSHELVHYACFIQGEDYEDGTEYFERELRRCGVKSSRELRFCWDVMPRTPAKKTWWLKLIKKGDN